MSKKFKTPKISCQNAIQFTCPDQSVEKVLSFLQKLENLGGLGGSDEVKIFWDGDGCDKLSNIIINGMTIKDWEKEWERLDAIKETKIDVQPNQCETDAKP